MIRARISRLRKRLKMRMIRMRTLLTGISLKSEMRKTEHEVSMVTSDDTDNDT